MRLEEGGVAMGMLFAVSPGSVGSGDERYIAYLPFVLSPGAKFQSVDGPVKQKVGDLDLKLEKFQTFYAISSGPCPSTARAAEHLDDLRASLLWLSLKRGMGVSYSRSVENLTLFDTPQAAPPPNGNPIGHVSQAMGWSATDGYYDAGKATVLPEHKRLIRWEMGRAALVLGVSVGDFFECLIEAMSFKELRRVTEASKLKLAIELYAAYRFELSSNAQLITLISALESLLPEVEIPACADAALTQAKEAVATYRGRFESASPEWSAINRLLSRMGDLRTESIGRSLRTYVSSVVSRHADLGDPESVSVKLRDAYSVRSTLLHTGSAGDQDIENHLSFLREFVPQLLKVLFKEAAKAT